jgi:flagellar biosynthesis protein FlhA
MSDNEFKSESASNYKKRFLIISVLVLIAILFSLFPAFLLDILWCLILALLIFLIAVIFQKKYFFSRLPSCLLILTLLSLMIQISFVRLIFINGEDFDGKIIRFILSLIMYSGEIRGLIIGTLTFLILTIIMMLVVTKGAARIAEITVLIILDSLPEKQMAIEAMYSSGTITNEEANTQKNALQCEVDFYGALDGASKFISGHFKFTIFITAISIIGGIAIGTLLNGETIGNAMLTYIPLCVCNSFLAQFLILLKSTITGIVVTGTALPQE